MDNALKISVSNSEIIINSDDNNSSEDEHLLSKEDNSILKLVNRFDSEKNNIDIQNELSEENYFKIPLRKRIKKNRIFLLEMKIEIINLLKEKKSPS